MCKLLIRETFVNDTEHHQFGESDPHEPFTADPKRLFAELRKEYGRPSSMYADKTDGSAEQVGWVFSKRMRYEDARGNDPEKDFYTRSVWVHLYASCKPDDPRATVTEAANGAVTRHPFRTLGVKEWRRMFKAGEIE